MAYKMIQVGTGGFGIEWCRAFLPANIRDGLIEVVAAVDINETALEHARTHLGLRDDQCFTDLKKAFDETPADFCTIVVPPAYHEQVVDLALAHDMDILSEKPIADSMETSLRIANKVKAAGKKMGITLSHRFDQDKTTLREELRSGKYGRLDYIVHRFTCECRRFGSWGKFRHEIPDPLMVEGSVHHLDFLVDMMGGRCDTIYAQTWNPPWGEFAGDSQALVMLRCENGARATYEGAKTNAVGLNWWAEDYMRAECELATLILNHRHLEYFPFNPEDANPYKLEGQGAEIPLLEQPKWAHAWLIEQFVQWLDGGEAMATNVEDSLQSVALVFAAIESSRSGMPVKVQEFLAAARRRVESDSSAA